jgi:hypothetical protein
MLRGRGRGKRSNPDFRYRNESISSGIALILIAAAVTSAMFPAVGLFSIKKPFFGVE